MITDTATMTWGIPQCKEGNPNCKHKWVYDNQVFTTNPPIVYRICKECGRVEPYQEEVNSIPSFADIYRKFHK